MSALQETDFPIAGSAGGGSLPLHATADGEVLPAMHPEKELRTLQQHLRLEPLTKNTIVDWDELDRGEYRMGIRGVGTVLRGPMAEIGPISSPVPTDRFIAN